MAPPTNQTNDSNLDLLEQSNGEESAYLNGLAEKAHEKQVAEQAKAARATARVGGSHKDNILNDVLKATGHQPNFGMDWSDRAVTRKDLVRTAYVKWELDHGHIPNNQIAETKKLNDATINSFSPKEKDALRDLSTAFNTHQHNPELRNVIGDIVKSDSHTIDSATQQAQSGHFQNYEAPFNDGFLASHRQAIGTPSQNGHAAHTGTDLLQQSNSEEKTYLNGLAEKAHEKQVAEQAKAARATARVGGSHKDNILNDVLKATGHQPNFGMDWSDRAVTRKDLVRTAFVRWEVVHGHVPQDRIAETKKLNDATINSFSPKEKDALRYLGGAFNKHQNDPEFRNVISDIVKSDPHTIDSAAQQAQSGHFQNYEAPFNDGFLASHRQAIGTPSHHAAAPTHAVPANQHIAPAAAPAAQPAPAKATATAQAGHGGQQAANPAKALTTGPKSGTGDHQLDARRTGPHGSRGAVAAMKARTATTVATAGTTSSPGDNRINLGLANPASTPTATPAVLVTPANTQMLSPPNATRANLTGLKTAGASAVASTPESPDAEFMRRTHGPNAENPNAVELDMAKQGKQTKFGENFSQLPKSAPTKQNASMGTSNTGLLSRTISSQMHI